MRLFYEFRSHLKYKIILPFLILTLLVALAGSAVAFLFVTGTSQEHLNNQLAQAARTTSDNLVAHEEGNLQFLREASFAGPNPATGAPAVADALAAGDTDGLRRALDPYFRTGTQSQRVRIDRLIVFDRSGTAVIDWEQQGSDLLTRIEHPSHDLSKLWFVPRILARQQDAFGDKFAGLLGLSSSDTRYFFTVAPVLHGDEPVGGIIAATRLDTLLADLSAGSVAAITAVYSADDGIAFASTQVPVEGLETLRVRPDLLPLARDPAAAEEQSVFDTVTVNGRQYQFAYAPLEIRGTIVGIIAVAFSTDYVTGPWAAARVPLIGLTIVLMLAIFGLGIYITRQITRPLQELVTTAQAVTSGDLERRSQVQVNDEIGILSDSFNTMTVHLLDMYRRVSAESSRRAAIVESITDGIVVCSSDGKIELINQATRTLLGLDSDAPPPDRFTDLPLQQLEENPLSFDNVQVPHLFQLGQRVVRVASAPVIDDDGGNLGEVFVLQDLTNEVAIDRAKTGFIATISHELRTPLTVLGGSSELLLRGLVGPLNDEQKTLVDSIRKHTQTMTTLLNNVITIAGIESGTLEFEVRPIDLQLVLDDLLWSVRPSMAAKGLELAIDIPEDLPQLLADPQQLRIVLTQLLDNARRYTEQGSVAIRASTQQQMVRVDVIDTGPGISEELRERLFTRFARGAEGINSQERGIGLGLAIARMLIERQGGQIWLEETSERGSTFSFTLPSIYANADPHSQNSSFATAA